MDAVSWLAAKRAGFGVDNRKMLPTICDIFFIQILDGITAKTLYGCPVALVYALT